MGGTQSKKLNKVSKNIWDWCEQTKIFIFASYISSSNNIDADFESRRLEPETEYQLSEKAHNNIVSVFGKPDIDLFASRSNTKCNKYFSWKNDPFALQLTLS